MRGISKQPSPYKSPLLFHTLRASQVLSSLIVTTILAFFIRHLEIELYYVPWTFILLLSVSVFTLASFVITSVLHHQRTLKPKINALINSFLSILWMLGFALLAWNLSVTLSHRCTIANWSTEAGVMICRIYKALMAFTITGMLSTLLATILDIHTHRSSSQRGLYNPMADPKPVLHSSQRSPSPFASTSPYNNQRSASYHDAPNATSSYADLDNSRESPREVEGYGLEQKPYKTQRPIEVNQFGYSAPSEQTAYDGAGDLGLQGWGRNGEGA